jgi:hypothetical protein
MFSEVDNRKLPTVNGSRRRIVALAIAMTVVVGVAASASASAEHDRSAVRIASRVQPRLKLRPTVVAAGARLTFVGSGFRPGANVWLGVGPPQSEARTWGSTRTNRSGAFRKTLTVNPRVQPGRWVALACQRACRIKAGASFRIVRGRG